MPRTQADTSMLQKQLAACREERATRRSALETCEYDGELLPLVENQDEFVWFASRTGRAAWKTTIASVRDTRSSWKYTGSLLPLTRVFCANSRCGTSVSVEAGDKKCPSCGTDAVVVLFRLPTAAEVGPPMAATLPRAFRGRPLGFWAIVWGLAVAFFAWIIADAPAWAQAGYDPGTVKPVLVLSAVLSYGVLRYWMARRRGGVMVDSKGLAFRKTAGSDPKTVPFTEIHLVRLESVTIRGVFFLPTVHRTNIELRAADGSRLFAYQTEWLGPADEFALLETVRAAAPDVSVFAADV